MLRWLMRRLDRWLGAQPRWRRLRGGHWEEHWDRLAGESAGWVRVRVCSEEAALAAGLDPGDLGVRWWVRCEQDGTPVPTTPPNEPLSPEEAALEALADETSAAVLFGSHTDKYPRHTRRRNERAALRRARKRRKR